LYSMATRRSKTPVVLDKLEPSTAQPVTSLETRRDYATGAVDDLQLSQLKVEWVPRSLLRPNKYNPNKMTLHDRALLKQSILEDGWTQPIVTLLDGTIVDGEQRWTVAGGPITSGDIETIIAKMESRRAEGYLISDSILQRLQTSLARVREI